MTNLAWFLIQIGCLVLPLLLLARFRVYPRAPLVLLLLAPAALSLISIIFYTLSAESLLNSFYPVLWSLDGLVALVALIDLLRLPRKTRFQIERQMVKTASLQKPHPVRLVVSYLGNRRRQIRVRDDVPQELNPTVEEFQFWLDPRSRTQLSYELRSVRRGAFQLESVHVACTSPWLLWQRFYNYPLQNTVHVYPDLKQVSQYAMLARMNRLSLMGVRRTRRVGGDNEFERLRDYTRDDNYRHIDWRSTARRGKLTVKDFQTEQSQRIIFLVDCGRMMTNEAARLSLLDHSFNAMLMLSYVALGHGDQVGLLTFSDRIHGYVPPASGRLHMNRLLHESFDRFPQMVESRYDRAFLYLGTHCKKRSLVVLMTNVIDEVNGNQVEQYLGSLSGRHLPMGVLLRDRRIFEMADHPKPVGGQLYNAAAAASILLWRHQILRDLEAKGVLCLDVFPDDLTAPLVNQYLDIKARHLL
ncbi:Cell division protein DivIC (FtsB), stabilizes FtsL against RasP cleavage [Planctomycetales bacterium 10988]|nr:Cell division protein DivIC (FtsB), stabilizes FtsL against RasP cleavage [Planctomycetales bacterium 10988]